MKNTSIGVRLGAAFGFILILLIVLSLTGYSRIQSLGDTAEMLAGSRYEKASSTAELRYYATDMTRLVRNVIILQGNTARQEKFRNDYDTLLNKMGNTSDAIDRLLTSPQEKQLMAAIQEKGRQYQSFTSEVLALGMQNKRDEATQLLFGPRLQTQNDYTKAIADMVTWQETAMRDAATAASAERHNASLMLIGISIASVFLAALLAWVITRSITRPLNIALQASQRIARGDLSGSVPVSGGDETGRLLQAINDMQASLVKTVSAVRRNAESVASASLQIAQGNSELSQRTEEQASALEQTAATMSELSVTVRNNADNARQASQLAVNVREIAGRGSEVTTEINGTMKTIGESSKRIADITSVIDGIAFQTNILALNAAVEAARAGEQGRGFAVVAGEVRTLAQRSATAAGEIRQLIAANSASVSAGSSLAERSAETMLGIVTSVGQLTDTVEEITAASGEQARGIEQVGIAVTEMDGVTQQNASLVEESASASQSLREQADHLLQSVSVFTLASAATALAVLPKATVLTPVAAAPARISATDNWTTF